MELFSALVVLLTILWNWGKSHHTAAQKCWGHFNDVTHKQNSWGRDWGFALESKSVPLPQKRRSFHLKVIWLCTISGQLRLGSAQHGCSIALQCHWLSYSSAIGRAASLAQLSKRKNTNSKRVRHQSNFTIGISLTKINLSMHYM